MNLKSFLKTRFSSQFRSTDLNISASQNFWLECGSTHQNEGRGIILQPQSPGAQPIHFSPSSILLRQGSQVHTCDQSSPHSKLHATPYASSYTQIAIYSAQTCTLEIQLTLGRRGPEHLAQEMSEFCITQPGAGRGTDSKQSHSLQPPDSASFASITYQMLLYV